MTILCCPHLYHLCCHNHHHLCLTCCQTLLTVTCAPISRRRKLVSDLTSASHRFQLAKTKPYHDTMSYQISTNHTGRTAPYHTEVSCSCSQPVKTTPYHNFASPHDHTIGSQSYTDHRSETPDLQKASSVHVLSTSLFRSTNRVVLVGSYLGRDDLEGHRSLVKKRCYWSAISDSW